MGLRGVLLCALLCATGALDAGSVALQALGDNGHAFVSRSRRVDLHFYDAPGLLDLDPKAQAELLDQVARAGFNAVAFEAPLFGRGGLYPKLDSLSETAAARFSAGFLALWKRGLYALPVLHTPASGEALIGAKQAPVVFFGGRRALGWQLWALKQLAALKVGGQPLGHVPGVAGWILYRGPWPDSAPMQGRPALAKPSAEDYLRQWAVLQVKAARQAGLKQPLGLGLWPKQDIGAAEKRRESLEADSAAPFAPLSPVEAPPSITAEQALALDALPPVPGTADDSLSSPWDLEGLDWGAVETLFETLPLKSQLDFLEFSLETEDWYRVGKRLALAAAKAEVPVLWRQDWRRTSRYERPKRLLAPEPLAGLGGGWPEEDWPEEGEALWRDDLPPELRPTPFKPTALKLKRQGQDLVMELSLSHEGQVLAEYGTAYPLELEAEGAEHPALEHRVLLPGLSGRQPFLFRLRLKGPQGMATLRTRWARPPR